MNRKLAELTVKKSADYHDKVVKALENAGFAEIKTMHHVQKPWITVIARK